MDAARAGSLEQPAPSLPPGALWLEGKSQQDGATGGPGPRQVAGSSEGARRAARPGGEVWSLPRRLSGTVPPAVGLPTDSPSGRRRRGRPEARGCHPLSVPLGVHPSLRRAGILALGTSGRSRGSEPRRATASAGGRLSTVSGGSFRPAPEPGTQGAQPEVPTAPEGEEGLFVATLHLCDLRLQFLQGRSPLRMGRGWFGLSSPTF